MKKTGKRIELIICTVAVAVFMCGCGKKGKEEGHAPGEAQSGEAAPGKAEAQGWMM